MHVFRLIYKIAGGKDKGRLSKENCLLPFKYVLRTESSHGAYKPANKYYN